LKRPSEGLRDLKLDWREKDYEKLQVILEKFKNKYPKMKLSVDCSLARIMRRNGLPFLFSKGIVGCSGGKSFLVVRANGDIYPCCFLNSLEHRIGNFLNANLGNIVEKINSSQVSYQLKFEDCPVS
jgi:MoaA/NifB/PqqE/SkfB family radical SAM enzyme